MNFIDSGQSPIPTQDAQQEPQNGAEEVRRIHIVVEAQGPLLLGGSLPIGNVLASLHYITGSAWRGAVARTILDGLGTRRRGWKTAQAAPNAKFEEVFGGNKPAHFSCLYPVRRCAKCAMQSHAMPIPLTAQQCKQVPGFPNKGHGVYDSLLNRIRRYIEQTNHAGSHNSSQANRERGPSAGPTCPVAGCQSRLERMRGYVGIHPERVKAPSRAFIYQQEKVDTHSFVRVGLNRFTETAQEQILFVHDALILGPDKDGVPQSLTFVGHWQGTAAQEATFRQLLEEHLLPVEKNSGQTIEIVPNAYELRIGSARARGMGAVHLYLVDEPEPAGQTYAQHSVQERFHEFQPRDRSGNRLDETYVYGTLTLRSPMQLLDPLGMPTVQLNKEVLTAYAPYVPDSIEMVEGCSTVEQENQGGWSGAWGLPKPITSVISPGSVIVLCVKSSDEAALVDFLQHVETNGLGEQRALGWGDVLACADFHLRYDEALASDGDNT